MVKDGDTLAGVIDRPCPSCGDKVDVKGTSSDPETWTVS